MEYEWDEAKRARNLAKHGIDFAAVERFDWENAGRFLDQRKAYGETRWLALGNIGNRVQVLIYTTRATRIRVISLCKASNRGTARYEAALRTKHAGTRSGNPARHRSRSGYPGGH